MSLLLALSWTLASPPDEGAELRDILGRAAKLESYRFRGETEQERSGGGGETSSLEGVFRKDTGLHVTSAERGELFRRDGRVWIREAKGDWEEAAAVMRRLTGGLRPGAPGAPNPQRGALAGKLGFLNQKPPHEELRDLIPALGEVRKEAPVEVEGVKMSVYAADLKEEALKASPLGRRAGMAPGQAAPSFQGGARLWVNPEGEVCCLELRTIVSLTINGNAVEVKHIKRTEILEHKDVKLEVPEGLRLR